MTSYYALKPPECRLAKYHIDTLYEKEQSTTINLVSNCALVGCVPRMRFMQFDPNG